MPKAWNKIVLMMKLLASIDVEIALLTSSWELLIGIHISLAPIVGNIKIMYRGYIFLAVRAEIYLYYIVIFKL